MMTCDDGEIVGVVTIDVTVEIVDGTGDTGELVDGADNVVVTPTPTCKERGSATAEPE